MSRGLGDVYKRQIPEYSDMNSLIDEIPVFLSLTRAYISNLLQVLKIEKLNLINKLKFIDIGVPRNISNDVKQHEFVKSFDVDDLQEHRIPFLVQFLIEQVLLLQN